jgi:hypothetical protein
MVIDVFQMLTPLTGILKLIDEKIRLSLHVKFNKCFNIIHEEIEYVSIFKINDSDFGGLYAGGDMVQKGCLAALTGTYYGDNLR